MSEHESRSLPLQMELALPIKKPTRRQKIRNWFLNLRRKEEELQLQPQWRSPALAFAVASSVASGPLLFIVTVLLFGRLGTRVPLFYNQLSAGSEWIQVDKAILLILPFVLSFVLYFLLKMLGEIFKIDRRLANLLCLILSLFNVCLLLAYSQIFSLTAF